MTVCIEHADMMEAIPRLVAEGVVCDAVVTDPPYNLSPMHKRFGGRCAAMPKEGRDGAHRRMAAGFMNQQWDGGDIAFRPETWATVATILRPGAFLVAFGGTRTYHRLVCAIENAGFVIQDQVAWIFGSGFPKRPDMLKPAWETICVAQKPHDLQRMLCELRNSLDRMATSQSGMAALISLSTVSLWLDILAEGSKLASTSTIGTESNTTIDWKTLRLCLSAITPESIIQAHSLGHLSIANASSAIRFFDAELSKLKLTRAPSVADLAISQAPIEHLAETGVEIEPICLAYKPGGKRTMQIDECRIDTAGRPLRERDAKATDAKVYSGRVSGDPSFSGGSKAIGETDLGRWPANICHDGSEEVLRGFPESAGQQGDVRGTEPSKPFGVIYGRMSRDTRPFLARNDSGSAARFFYTAKADTQDRWGSRHPTVKPTELICWLVKLVTPPGSTFIDPFAGSGTAGVAALATGRNAILIEREADYIADIRERMAHYEGTGRHSLAAKARRAPERPLGGLFDGSTPLRPPMQHEVGDG